MQPVALITGASRGIGRAIAERFAADGFRVAVVSTRQETAEKVASELSEAHDVPCLGIGADVGDEDQAKEVVSKTLEAFDKVDALINNAGITRDGLILRMKTSDWDDVLRTNLTANFYLCRAVSRPMVKAKGGSIVQIGSVVGSMGNAGQTNYAASKAGLIGFTKSLARELAGKNIRANVVEPGFIETDMTQSLGEAQRNALISQIPVRRLGSPEDVAGVVRFLCSGDARYITGQVLAVDGGMAM